MHKYATNSSVSVGLSSLKEVGGKAEVETSSNNANVCELFNDLGKKHMIKGEVQCRTSSSGNNGFTSSVGPSVGPSAGPSASDTSDDKLGIPIATIAGTAIGATVALAIVGIITFLCLRKKKRR